MIENTELNKRIKDGWKLTDSVCIGTSMRHSLEKSNGSFHYVCHMTCSMTRDYTSSIETYQR